MSEFGQDRVHDDNLLKIIMPKFIYSKLDLSQETFRKEFRSRRINESGEPLWEFIFSKDGDLIFLLCIENSMEKEVGAYINDKTIRGYRQSMTLRGFTDLREFWGRQNLFLEEAICVQK